MVPSDTRDDVEHLVELDAFDGLGKCACEDFDYRSRPKAEAGNRDPELRCRHIKRLRELFCDALIYAIQNQKTPPEPE